MERVLFLFYLIEVHEGMYAVTSTHTQYLNYKSFAQHGLHHQLIEAAHCIGTYSHARVVVMVG